MIQQSLTHLVKLEQTDHQKVSQVHSAGQRGANFPGSSPDVHRPPQAMFLPVNIKLSLFQHLLFLLALSPPLSAHTVLFGDVREECI